MSRTKNPIPLLQRYSLELKKNIVLDYLDGLSVNKIFEKYDLTRKDAVRQVLAEAKVTMRSQHDIITQDDEMDLQIRSMRKRGFSYTWIAYECEKCVNTIYVRVKTAEKRRKRHAKLLADKEEYMAKYGHVLGFKKSARKKKAGKRGSLPQVHGDAQEGREALEARESTVSTGQGSARADLPEAD